jgi:hypothetical protein
MALRPEEAAMHGTTRTRMHPSSTGKTGRNAVVWIGQGHALVLRDADAGGLDEAVVPFPAAPAATPAALAEIAHRLGAVDRILVMGSDELRTALEREIVAIGHAPETIRETAVAGPVTRDVLLERLHGLSARS